MGTTTSLKRQIISSFHSQPHQSPFQFIQSKRQGKPPSKQFDLAHYLKIKCKQKQEIGSYVDSLACFQRCKEEENKRGSIVIKAGREELRGLKDDGPHDVVQPIKYPYSAIGMVYSKLRGSAKAGTGCLIGPNLVLTCAHNLFSLTLKQLHHDIQFIPSIIQSKTKIGFKANIVYIPQEYKRAGLEIQPKINKKCCLYDYAIIVLEEAEEVEEWFGSIGYQFQWEENKEEKEKMERGRQGSGVLISVGGRQSTTVVSVKDGNSSQGKIQQDYFIYGYRTLKYGGVKFTSYSGNVYHDRNFLLYSMKTSHGISGAPVLTLHNGKYYIRAIHQRDISDIIDSDENEQRKAGLKLSGKMFRDAVENFRVQFHGYQLERKGIRGEYMGIVLEEIEKMEERYCKNGSKAMLTLNLVNNQVKDTGCQALLKANWTNILDINLWSNQITQNGMLFLSKTRWTGLKVINLRNNMIGDKGCSHLAEGPWRQIQKIDLWMCGIGDHGIQYLSKTKWVYLTVLNLRNNSIGDNGCHYLSLSSWRNLQQLNLRNNKIRQKGCQYLSQSQYPRLHILNLRGNMINDDGCDWLSQSNWKQLQTLDLFGNTMVSTRGREHFRWVNWKIYYDQENQGRNRGRNKTM